MAGKVKIVKNNSGEPINIGWVDGEGDCPEGCPMCACEVEANFRGTSRCEECGHPNVLPCRECTDANNEVGLHDNCDWEEDYRCTPFPIEEPPFKRYGVNDKRDGSGGWFKAHHSEEEMQFTSYEEAYSFVIHRITDIRPGDHVWERPREE